MSDACCQIEAANREERRVLWILLAINGGMFLGEATAGWMAESSALIADSLDMLADACVYALSLYAVGRAARDKSRAAVASGTFQTILAGVVGLDVVQRLAFGSDPVSGLIIGVAAIALVANLACMALLAAHRKGGVHMRVSWTCSTNDVLVNSGVIAAGSLVYATGSRWPDLVVGSVVAVVVLRRALRILGEARGSLAELPTA